MEERMQDIEGIIKKLSRVFSELLRTFEEKTGLMVVSMEIEREAPGYDLVRGEKVNPVKGVKIITAPRKTVVY